MAAAAAYDDDDANDRRYDVGFFSRGSHFFALVFVSICCRRCFHRSAGFTTGRRLFMAAIPKRLDSLNGQEDSIAILLRQKLDRHPIENRKLR